MTAPPYNKGWGWEADLRLSESRSSTVGGAGLGWLRPAQWLVWITRNGCTTPNCKLLFAMSVHSPLACWKAWSCLGGIHSSCLVHTDSTAGGRQKHESAQPTGRPLGMLTHATAWRCRGQERKLLKGNLRSGRCC